MYYTSSLITVILVGIPVAFTSIYHGLLGVAASSHALLWHPVNCFDHYLCIIRVHFSIIIQISLSSRSLCAFSGTYCNHFLHSLCGDSSIGVLVLVSVVDAPDWHVTCSCSVEGEALSGSSCRDGEAWCYYGGYTPYRRPSRSTRPLVSIVVVPLLWQNPWVLNVQSYELNARGWGYNVTLKS